MNGEIAEGEVAALQTPDHGENMPYFGESLQDRFQSGEFGGRFRPGVGLEGLMTSGALGGQYGGYGGFGFGGGHGYAGHGYGQQQPYGGEYGRQIQTHGW